MIAKTLIHAFALVAVLALTTAGSAEASSYCPGDEGQPQEPTTYCPGDEGQPDGPSSFCPGDEGQPQEPST